MISRDGSLTRGMKPITSGNAITTGGRLATWLIDSGPNLDSINKELNHIQENLNQLGKLIDNIDTIQVALNSTGESEVLVILVLKIFILVFLFFLKKKTFFIFTFFYFFFMLFYIGKNILLKHNWKNHLLASMPILNCYHSPNNYRDSHHNDDSICSQILSVVWITHKVVCLCLFSPHIVFFF